MYFAHLPPVCSEQEARDQERALAVRLHKKGYKVEGDGLPDHLRR